MVKIVETNLRFSSLARRNSTNRIIIHHTGTVQDTNLSAAHIHDFHKNGNGWAGIGYHFVIRKDGTIERGRPEWAIGAHTAGHNSDSIGIHFSGDFNAAVPTDAQIESGAMLIAALCDRYNIPTDRSHIKGHYECDDPRDDGSGCPGRNLFKMLDIISGKANWYRYNPGKACPTCGRDF